MTTRPRRTGATGPGQADGQRGKSGERPAAGRGVGGSATSGWSMWFVRSARRTRTTRTLCFAGVGRMTGVFGLTLLVSHASAAMGEPLSGGLGAHGAHATTHAAPGARRWHGERPNESAVTSSDHREPEAMLASQSTAPPPQGPSSAPPTPSGPTGPRSEPPAGPAPAPTTPPAGGAGSPRPGPQESQGGNGAAGAKGGAGSAPAAAPPPTPRDGVERDGTERIAKSAQNNPTEGEMTPDLEPAIARGLEYLKSLQNADGSFGRGKYGRHVGITGLCAIAFMADGSVPGRGKYGDVVKRALDFVLEHSTETGLLAAEATNGPMYGHGFAALFLGEVYGMNPDDERVRDALTRAVQLIVNSQNDDGGWRYNPVPYDADVSVTICQVMALRSARNAGVKVPKETVDAAIRYVRECQNPDGGFRYMKDPGGSAWPRTAAGVASLFYAGVYEDQAIDRGLDYLMQTSLPTGTGSALGQAHYFYGHYYAVQAMYLAGGERWQKWWPAIRGELIARQEIAGGWLDHQAGDAYGTAMALIILQMPKRYLPIFQK